MKRIVTALALAIISKMAFATAVIPVSYTFDQANGCGSWCYFDPNFTKLTDGVIGDAGWAVNQGQEWDGWVGVGAVNIDFNFGQAVNLNSVAIGSTQDNLGDVALPSFQVSEWVGSQWVSVGSIINPPSSSNDNSAYSTAPHPFYTLSNLNIDSQYVRVTATANGPWIFVDEVQFGSAVPEPESYALFGLGAGLALWAARRNKKV